MFDFIFFRRMLTPVLIQILFWAGIIFCIVAGFVDIFSKHSAWNGIKILILGPIAIRMACEVFILFFCINETLTDIKNTITKE